MAPMQPISTAAYGRAMIFVLLTYGGWSEASYLAAELHDAQHNMSRVLVLAIAIITGIPVPVTT